MFSHSFWNYFFFTLQMQLQWLRRRKNLTILKKEKKSCILRTNLDNDPCWTLHGKTWSLYALFVCPWTKGGSFCWLLKTGIFLRKEIKKVSVYFCRGRNIILSSYYLYFSFLFSLWCSGSSLLCAANYSHQLTH